LKEKARGGRVEKGDFVIIRDRRGGEHRTGLDALGKV